ncbi:MAG: hypothetical protein RID53_02400 [Coleofasciculus sp. B1-GNL1-01]|uniref:hypothetical protein n=1 Tax=Coleofasciculus sp. B1-GNL1-01 TaxID=3068484 RepID=UPI0032F98C21
MRKRQALYINKPLRSNGQTVQVLPGIRFPEIINWDEKLIATSYVLPDVALADVPDGKAVGN